MMMLRYRSRLVTSKQAKVADHNSITSPTQDQTIPISPFSHQTSFLRGFVFETEVKYEAEALSSPISPFKTEPMFSFGKPIWYDNIFMHKSSNIFPGYKHYCFMENLKRIRIGLFSIVNPFPERKPQDTSYYNKKTNKKVVSATELEILRLQTKVSLKGVVFDSEVKSRKGNTFTISKDSFLSFCYTCKKKLGEGKDIYIYKGEKAFCSPECRCQEMLLDGVENSGF